MSLLRLLTTCKTLVSVQDMESRYRLTSQRLLPHFGPARNPFSSRAEADSAPTPALHGGAPAGTLSPKPGAWGLARALWLKTSTLWSGGKAKLSGLAVRPRATVAKPAISQFAKPPVQGELSLDRVKVVRNDLSEADVEVVPAKPKVAPALLAVAPEGEGESSWGWTMPRIFHAGKR